MNQPESRFVNNRGVRLHYVEWDGAALGRPAREIPIVFVPGMSDLATDYVPILATLGRHCAVLDLRGHGPSDSPPEGYTLEDQVSDIATLVDEITDGPIHLMTFSRGTCYALGWAIQHPDRVLSVAIGDYPAREIALPAKAVESFLAGRWRGTPVSRRVTRHAAEQTFAAAVDRPFWDQLVTLDVPLLVVRSTADFPVTDEDWDRYRSTMPHAELLRFDESPHDIFRPDRVRYPQLVRAHVERSEQSAGDHP